MSVSIPQRLLVSALTSVTGTLLACQAAPALAAPGGPARQAPIDIPAQPLGRALHALSNQTGVQILAPGDAVAGRAVPALSGRFTPRQALERLLAGSNLVVRANDSGMLIVHAAGGSTAAGVPHRMASVWLDYTVLPGLTLSGGARMTGPTGVTTRTPSGCAATPWSMPPCATTWARPRHPSGAGNWP